MLILGKSRFECEDFNECMDCVRTYIILGVDFKVRRDEESGKWIITMTEDDGKFLE